MNKDKKILEEAYFHIHNGNFTIRFEEGKKAYSPHEEDRTRNMVIDLGNFGKHLSVIIPLSRLNWDWLKEVFNRVLPPVTNGYEPEKSPVTVYKNGEYVEKTKGNKKDPKTSLGHLCISN